MGMDEDTFFDVVDLFCIHLGQFSRKKIFAEISGKKFQIFHCSNVTIGTFSQKYPRTFFLENPKIYLVPRYIQKISPTYLEECNFILALLRSLSIKQFIALLG